MASIGETRAAQIHIAAQEAGLSDDELVALMQRTARGIHDRLSDLELLNRKDADRLESEIGAAARKAQKAAAGASEPLATGRQVDYILSLLARRSRTGNAAGFMTGPTIRDEIQRMTRQQASTYIDSLTENY